MRVSVEFVMFHQKSSHLNGNEEDCANGLMKRISEIDGCSLKYYLPGGTIIILRLILCEKQKKL